MISYIESMWTLTMIVVQPIGNWDLDFAPFRPLTYILVSYRKVSEIDPQWLKSQWNDHKYIIFDLSHSRSCSTQFFTSENHPRSISQLKPTITVEIRPLTVDFKFFKLQFRKNGDIDVDFDLSHYRSCSKERLTLEHHPESILRLRFTITVEIWPLYLNSRILRIWNKKIPGVVTNPMMVILTVNFSEPFPDWSDPNRVCPYTYCG